MAEVRRLSGVPVMADEAVLGAHDALRAVRLRACDLINIKLMKCGGLLAALALDAVGETAGVGCQIGTMVESSVASAAGLHLALALHNAATVEMGGPIMLAEDVSKLRAYYERDRVTAAHDVARKLPGKAFLAHGVAAILDDDGFLVILLHVRQRFRQDAGLIERADILR